MDADVIIVGGGVAGLSLAAALAPERRVLLLETEAAIGYHASGRSATFSHFGIGNAVVRALTSYSRASFEAGSPDGHSLGRIAAALFVATEPMLGALDQLASAMSRYAPALQRCSEAEMRALFPPLRVGPDHVVAGLLDPNGLRLDSDLLLQGYRRTTLRHGGAIRTGAPVSAIHRDPSTWSVECGGETHRAPILVNAAGAWADQVAALAGVASLGLTPLRRTIIVIDPPPGADVRGWPFVKTVVDDFYILPEGGRLAASPVDEVPSEPCDAQPDDYDVALAAAKVEQYTDLPVARVAHRWAGLRTFAPDRTPVVGFDPKAEGFFWLAGQGGFGLQTAPAIAEAAAALITGALWPEGLARLGVSPHQLAPERFMHV
jgi:D-arginine dehydrogenase